MKCFCFFFLSFLFFSFGGRKAKSQNKKPKTQQQKSHDKLKPKINILLHRTENYYAKVASCRWSTFSVSVFPHVEAPANNKICLVYSRAVQSSKVKALHNTEEQMHDCLLYGHHIWDSQCVIFITPTPPPSRR